MEELPQNPVTSPTLPTDPGIVVSDKHFSDMLTLDLTDEEIKKAFELITKIKAKWSQRFIYKFNDMSVYPTVSHAAEEAAKMVDAFETELHETLAEQLHIMVAVDMAPVFDHGGAPVVEVLGALPSHSSAMYGLDHEKKEWEVKKAKERGEDYYGQKYESNPGTKRKQNIKANKRSKKR